MGKVITCGVLALSLFIAGPALAQAKKAKPSKVTGNIGLLDLDKNYMIVVTKEGKLVTVDFNNKTKVTEFVPHPAKMSDVNLGQAASITYKKEGDKNVIDAIDVKVKAKKGK